MTEILAEQPMTIAAPPGDQAGRWRVAILAGLVAGIPVSILLSYAGLLPFYLGPFFFLLFGLIIGAAMFRIAKVIRPLSRLSILTGGVAVIVVVFVASLTLEYMQLAPHVSLIVARKTRVLPPGQGPAEFRDNIQNQLRAYIAREYPPGGVVGYARWAAVNGQFSPETPEAIPPTITYTFAQSRVGWSLRVLTSLCLLVGGVLSQILPLGHIPAAKESPLPPKTPTGLE